MSQHPIRRRLAAVRRAAVASAAAADRRCSSLMPDARAAAGRYEVVQCDRSNRDFADASFDRVNGGDYGFLYRCEEDEDANSLQIRSITGAPQGRYGRISWTAPAETRIVGVDVEARMRSDAGHQARLSFLDADGAEAGTDRDRHATRRDRVRALRQRPRRRRPAGLRAPACPAPTATAAGPAIRPATGSARSI